MNNFNWNPKSNLFHFQRIENKVNADKLFVSFLLEVEKNSIDPSKIFTIEEITEFVPKGTANITSAATYGYSITSMFSTVKNRDYFIFEDTNLSDNFSSICNDQNRDNYYWKKYPFKEKAKINPKYIKLT